MHHSNHSGTITVGDPETRHFGDKGWIARYLRKMATIGQLEVFQPDNERMSAYLKRVQMFFVAKGVKTEKQVPVLLSVIGAKTYAIHRDFLLPEKPSEKTFCELQEVLFYLSAWVD